MDMLANCLLDPCTHRSVLFSAFIRETYFCSGCQLIQMLMAGAVVDK